MLIVKYKCDRIVFRLFEILFTKIIENLFGINFVKFANLISIILLQVVTTLTGGGGVIASPKITGKLSGWILPITNPTAK